MSDEWIHGEDTKLSPEVMSLVDYIWHEASGSLSDVLSVPVKRIKFEEVEKAEGYLTVTQASSQPSPWRGRSN